MKTTSILFTLLSFFFLTTTLNAQECGPFTAESSGNNSVQITSENGTCFKFFLEGFSITPDYTNDLTFRAKRGDINTRLELADGTVIEKKLVLAANNQNFVYTLKRNKKNKWVVRLKVGLGGGKTDGDVAENTEPAKEEKVKEPKEEKVKEPKEEKVKESEPVTPPTPAVTCSPYKQTNSGAIRINVESETGECFRFFVRGEEITPGNVSSLIFFADVPSVRMKVVMPNGQEAEKKLMLSPDYASLLVLIKKNKKGQYSLKNKLGQSEITAEAAERREKEREEAAAKRKAEQEARDREWDEARAKEKAEREAKREAEEREEAEREAAERESASTSSGSSSSGSSSGSMSSGSSSGGSSSGGSISAGGGSNEVPMMLLYDGQPLGGWDITLEVDGITYGSCKTASDGTCTIKTSAFVNTESAYKLSGKKGSTSWNFSGLFLLNVPPKVTPVPMEVVVHEMSAAMGLSESMLANSWGLK